VFQYGPLPDFATAFRSWTNATMQPLSLTSAMDATAERQTKRVSSPAATSANGDLAQRERR
jgi:hypothetical protein